jgi:ribosomal silencing factor RsfS
VVFISIAALAVVILEEVARRYLHPDMYTNIAYNVCICKEGLQWTKQLIPTLLCAPPCSGLGGSQELFIVASGVSQQHTQACAEAIKWQLEQKMEQLIYPPAEVHSVYSSTTTSTDTTNTSSSSTDATTTSTRTSNSSSSSSDSDEEFDRPPSEQQQQQELAAVAPGTRRVPASGVGGSIGVLPVRLQVVGAAAADWAVLEAGRVGVHVLTAAARDYYALDLLWSRGDEARVTRFKGDGSIMTKDSIRHWTRQEAGGVSAP